MHASTVWSVLPLLAGLFSPQAAWKTDFDYTRLPPSNDDLWGPLVQAAIPMETAIEVVRKSESGPVHFLRGELDLDSSPATWRFLVFVGKEDGFQRVNLSVSTLEPTVLRRLELNSLTDPEKELLPKLGREIPAESGILASKEKLGDSSNPKGLKKTLVRKIELKPEGKVPNWEIEVMGLGREVARRYACTLGQHGPRLKMKHLLDRYPGEPLRAAQAVEGEAGMFLHDFKVGDGDVLTADSMVKVNYRLFLLDNSKIQDTYKSKLPETFKVANAPLKGMTMGMLGMRVGGRRKICMPPELGFGVEGSQLAPPMAMIVCDVQVESLVAR